MTSMTIEDPDLVETKNVDTNGKVHLGSAYAHSRVTIIIENLPEDGDGDD